MKTILAMLKKLIFTVSNVDQAIQDNSVSEYESENGIVVFTTVLLDLKKR